MRRKSVIVLVAILFLAGSLRLYKIGQIPRGLAFDEAAIVYNAWSISIWHRDEFATFMPLSFRSFGDDKPPLLIYTLALGYKLFGLHEEYIRIWSALMGIGSVAAVYYIAQELKLQNTGYLPEIAAFLLAVSSWSVTLSRVGFEQNTAFFLINLGLLGLLLAKKQPLYVMFSVAAFGLSLYTFHTAKIFVPFMLLGFLLVEKKYRWRGAGVLAGVLLISLPLLLAAFHGQGVARAQTLILASREPLTELLHNLSAYASPGFWVGGWDAISIRHVVPDFGVLYYIEFGYVCLGLGLLLSRIGKTVPRLMWWWFMGGLLPGLLTQGAPHALRSLFTAAPAAIIAAYGFTWILQQWPQRRIRLVVAGGSALMLGINIGGYLQAYYGPYATASAPAFQYGYREVIQAVNRWRQDDENVVMTDRYGQPYIYTLLYNRITPQQFQFGALNSYEFRHITWPENIPHRLYAGTPQEISPGDPRVVETITIPGTQQVAWVIAKTE